MSAGMSQSGKLIKKSLKILIILISIPNLIPERVCRKIPKEVCQVVFLNPRIVKVRLFILIEKKH